MALWRVRATVDDRPGFLAVLTASLALRSVNILSVQVHATEGGAVDDFLVDAPDALTEQELMAAVLKGRGRDPWLRRADAHGLVDTPTQLLGLAGRLARDPEELAGALVALLSEGVGDPREGEQVRVYWRPDETLVRAGFSANLMRLPDPAGGTLFVERVAPPFTPAEYARAHALVDLAGAMLAGSARWDLLLPGGDEVTVRLGGPEDLDAIVELTARCSPSTRYRRFLAGGDGPSPAQLRRLLDAGHGRVLVAERDDDAGPQLVAVANLVWDGPEGELALLVEDGWQRRGIGTALLRRAVKIATGDGIVALHAHTHADNSPMIRTMRRLSRPLRHEADGALVTITADLRVDVPVAEPAAA